VFSGGLRREAGARSLMANKRSRPLAGSAELLWGMAGRAVPGGVVVAKLTRSVKLQKG
jgi:hypothetical protein